MNLSKAVWNRIKEKKNAYPRLRSIHDSAASTHHSSEEVTPALKAVRKRR
jgi:hypothetical protein